MAKLVLNAEHGLGADEAERRLKEKLRNILARYGDRLSDLREEWSGHTLSFGFKVVGMKVVGTLVVADTEVRLAARVPFAIAIVRGRIEQRLRAELGDLLV